MVYEDDKKEKENGESKTLRSESLPPKPPKESKKHSKNEDGKVKKEPSGYSTKRDTKYKVFHFFKEFHTFQKIKRFFLK